MYVLKWNSLLSHKRLGIEDTTDSDINAARSQFQRDYDRIIFSSPFRRLQNKTQVFPLPGSVFVHNRLTHSLEVASVGRSLGNILANELLRREPNIPQHTIESIGTIVSTACLAHDLGNPPFGHSGEQAISRYFKEIDTNNIANVLQQNQLHDFINFEGNANAFRLLTHQFTGRRKGGFSLTYATLGALLKYPCTSIDTAHKHGHYEKYGSFQSELATLRKVATELGLPNISSESDTVYGRHPLVYLVEAADDICYQIVDIEDAHRLNILSASHTKDLLLSFFDTQLDADALHELHQLLQEVTDENEQIVILRSRVINKLIEDCAAVFMLHYDSIMNCTFTSTLTKKLTGSSKTALAEIQKVATHKIYNSREVVEIQVAGHRILGELLQEFITASLKNESLYARQLLRLLPSQLAYENPSTYEKILSIVDYIAGMTDVYALEMYRKIKGISFSVIR